VSIEVPDLPVDVYQDPVMHELVVWEHFPKWGAAFESPYDPNMDDPAEDPEYVRAKRAGLVR
jgi:hypothetical protein